MRQSIVGGFERYADAQAGATSGSSARGAER